MRCTWKNLARHCYSPVVQQLPGFSTAFNCFSGRKFATAATSLGHSPSPIYTSSNHSSSLHNAFAHPSPVDPGVSPTGPQQLSAVQLSQAAAQAIRLSVNAGNLSDAFSILNSLYSATATPPPNLTSKHQILINAIRAHSSLKGRVSSRLPAHSLLHGLIRTGNVGQAAQLCGQILGTGLNIRSRSLNAVVATLGQAGILVFEQQGYATPKLHYRSVLSKPIHILPLPSQLSLFTAVHHAETDGEGRRNVDPTSQNPKQGNPSSSAIETPVIQPSQLTNSLAAQFALRLLDLARHARQRRTRTLFRTLITLCLINGEIILASLVFGVLIRDWQSRLDSLADQNGGDVTSKKGWIAESPAREQFYDICRTIDVALEAYPVATSPGPILADMEPPDNPSMDQPMPRQASLQALANLAYIAEQRVAGFQGLAPLIKLLGKYVQDAKLVPSTPREYVWVSSDKSKEGAVLVHVARYFETVLFGMIRSLRTPSPSIARRVLDIQSHNALLHFVLNQSSLSSTPGRLGPPVKIILDSLRSNHSGGDEATRNIILRGKHLLKKSAAIRQLIPRKEFTLVQCIKSGASHFTLSSKISHLISIGKPQKVVDALDLLLPGLSYESRIACPDRPLLIQRVITLGPFVLTCILNALRKVGKTSTAEQVWRLAQEAERVSMSSDNEPFILPIHAYTVMMGVYVAEARKTGCTNRRPWKWGIGAHSHIRRLARPDYVPIYGSRPHKQRNRRRAKVLQMRKQMTSREMGLFMSIRLYLEATGRERQLSDRYMSGVYTDKNFKPPVLDAQFFDTLLRVINLPRSVPKQGMTRPLWYHRRELRLAKRAFAFTGRIFRNRLTLPSGRPSHVTQRSTSSAPFGKLRIRDLMDERGNADMHTLLLHIVADMQRRGIGVPILFRKAVVGWISDAGVPKGGKDSRSRVWIKRKSLVVRRRRRRKRAVCDGKYVPKA